MTEISQTKTEVPRLVELLKDWPKNWGRRGRMVARFRAKGVLGRGETFTREDLLAAAESKA